MTGELTCTLRRYNVLHFQRKLHASRSAHGSVQVRRLSPENLKKARFAGGEFEFFIAYNFYYKLVFYFSITRLNKI